MNLSVVIKNNKVSLELTRRGKCVDRITLPMTNNLSNELLLQIDKLLLKNTLKKTDLKKVAVKSDLPESYTSGRIAKILAKTYQFGSALL